MGQAFRLHDFDPDLATRLERRIATRIFTLQPVLRVMAKFCEDKSRGVVRGARNI
jgi:hypothetical protein